MAASAFMSDCLACDPVEGGETLAARVLAQEGPFTTVMCSRDVVGHAEWLPVIGRDPSRIRALFELRRRRVERIVLVPDGGFSYAVLLRLWLIRFLMPRARVRLYVLQVYREPSRLARLAPRVTVVALNQHDADLFARAGVPTEVIETLVSPERISTASKSDARAALGLPAEGPVFLHVGHATAGRNLISCAELAEHGMLVLVMSPYSDLATEHLPTGPNVTVVHQRVDVGLFYRATDVYVFPTVDPLAVIGLPMSIAESLGNGTPVVARRGPLTERWVGVPDVTLVDSDEELLAEAVAVASSAAV